jgi:elongation factor P
MATVNAGNLSKGMYIIFKGTPHQVSKTEFMSPGKGTPVMRTRLKNVETGSVQEFTYKSAENVVVADVDKKEMQYLYRDGNDFVFMNPKNFDQVTVSGVVLDDRSGFLVADMKCQVLSYEDEVLGVELPPNVVLKVIEAPDSIAGNRINAPKKLIKVETGMTLNAPIFVRVGDRISVDTTSGEYLSRVNQ